jgi:hypothetical protein
MSVRPAERIREKLQELRGKRPILGGQVVGGGALVEKVRRRMETATARIKERKPGIVPKIREWKPGTRITELLAPQESSRFRAGVMDRPGMSVEVEGEQKKLHEERGMSVEW